MIQNSKGDTLYNVVANVNSSRLRGNDQSFDEASKDAITAMILNSSHESCCCSDDEFNTKYTSTSKITKLGG